MKFNCAYCGNESEKPAGHYNRSVSIGAPVYCGRTCAGLGRRNNKTIEQKKADKAEYDKKFRKEYTEEIKQKKAEAFKKWYYEGGGQEIERERRKLKMPKHVEYCRQPKYKEYKKQYDEKYHAKKQYGEFAEAAIALFKLEDELERKNPEMLAIKFQNNTLNKSQKRKRKWQSNQHNKN